MISPFFQDVTNVAGYPSRDRFLSEIRRQEALLLG